MSDNTLRPGEMKTYAMSTPDKNRGDFDWQLLRFIETGNPDYAMEHLTTRGIESLKRLEAAKYVHIEEQIVTVTTSGLAALMPNYSFSYACELTALRELTAELIARLDAMEGGK